MHSLQYRPQMDNARYTENGGRRRSRRPAFSSYLLWSICGLYCRLYMAYVQLMYGPYMAYAGPTYDTYRVQICDQFCDQICSTHRSPGYPGQKKCDMLLHCTVRVDKHGTCVAMWRRQTKVRKFLATLEGQIWGQNGSQKSDSYSGFTIKSWIKIAHTHVLISVV